MLKAVHFIITWLGLSCIWTTWLASCLSSNHPLNRTIQCLISSFAWDARTMRPEASTLLYPYHQHQIHPRWCHMGAFRHTWLWILNQMYVLSRLPAILVRKKSIIQVRTPHPEIWRPVKDIMQLYLREQHQVRIFLKPQPGSRHRFLFGPNNGPLRLKTHAPRRNKDQLLVQNPLLVPCLFPSSKNSHLRASTRMTRMMMQHPKPHPHMIIQLSTSVGLPNYHPPPPLPHHQALPRHWFSHQIPPFEFSNQQKLLDLPVTQHTVPGRTSMIKSWSISRMTPNLVLCGRRLALDFVVIVKYASWDGESWNKLTNMVSFNRLRNPRLRTKRQWHHTEKKCACLSIVKLFVVFCCPTFMRFPFSTVHLYAVYSSVNMAYAYSSDYVRIAPDRSCSRDEPMWQNRSHQRRRQYRDAWHDVPLVRQPRRVLIIVNLEAVRPLMTAVHDDAMDSTTCQSLPFLGRMEEYAFFTYNVLIHPHHVETLTVNILLYYISQHIMYTWDRQLDIFVGKTAQGIPWSFAMSTPWLTFFVNIVLIGLKAKNLGSCCRTMFDHSLPRISHTSCVWVAMRHSQAATCFHKSCRKKSVVLVVQLTQPLSFNTS